MSTPSRPDDPRARVTAPPNARRLDEDSPRVSYHELPRPLAGAGESIARVALRAPKKEAVTPHEEMLRALAATEGRMLAEIADRREEEDERQAFEREAFEERVRREVRELVASEVKSIPPPAPLPQKHRFELSHLQYLAAFIVALTGLIALILSAQKPSAEITKRFDALDAAVLKTDKKLDAHEATESAQRSDDRLKDYEYQLSVRSWITDVLEKAASVKIDDPPGTPAREQLRFYPAPRIDPHKVTDTHIVQPRDPYPVPPPP